MRSQAICNDCDDSGILAHKDRIPRYGVGEFWQVAKQLACADAMGFAVVGMDVHRSGCR
jgi:hypothetical protein